jgi:hypothetical protein
MPLMKKKSKDAVEPHPDCMAHGQGADSHHPQCFAEGGIAPAVSEAYQRASEKRRSDAPTRTDWHADPAAVNRENARQEAEASTPSPTVSKERMAALAERVKTMPKRPEPSDGAPSKKETYPAVDKYADGGVVSSPEPEKPLGESIADAIRRRKAKQAKQSDDSQNYAEGGEVHANEPEAFEDTFDDVNQDAIKKELYDDTDKFSRMRARLKARRGVA